MPFKSQAQRKFMYANHPEIAKEFESATPAGAKLPERVHPKDPHAQHKAMEKHTHKMLRKAGHGGY